MRLLILLCTLFLASPALAKELSTQLGGRIVFYWPPPPSESKQPVLLFSHGFHGCATQSTFLMQALAAEGYWVFAPNHADATCAGGKAILATPPDVPFRSYSLWNKDVYKDRAGDMTAVLEALKKSPLAEKIDFTRMGLIGHSLGGYTALGLAGAWPEWKIPGVKAVLALSPYHMPFVAYRTLGGLSAPVMYQGGTRDVSITPSVIRKRGAYDSSPTPKYYVEFDKAGHFAWTDIHPESHAGITAYSVAFLNHYVRGDTQTGLMKTNAVLTNLTLGAVDVRFESELGKNAVSSRIVLPSDKVGTGKKTGTWRDRLQNRLSPAGSSDHIRRPASENPDK